MEEKRGLIDTRYKKRARGKTENKPTCQKLRENETHLLDD